MRFALAALSLLLSPALAVASTCFAFVEGVPGIRYATLGPVAAAAPTVEIRYVGHSTYRIETPGGIAIATDYFGLDGPGGVPDVVTMNRAHETHYTDYPNPAITHVLRGWNPDGDGPAEHRVEVGDVLVRNVTTDIRRWGETGRDGNSIFVFEVAELCIAHLGHLHHPPTEEQYAALGNMDVLMVPVDGTYTMDVPSMIGVAKRLRSSVVLPMHYFGPARLERFLAGMADEFAIDVRDDPVVRVSRDTLPARPTVVVVRAVGRGTEID